MLYATHAVVHLDAIRHNLAQVRALVGPEPRIMAAVKADAYGHGAVPVARAIQDDGAADWLGVATVPEAIELREAGVGLPILKLSHAIDAEEIAAAIAHDVTLTVSHPAGAREVGAVAAAAGTPAAVHLKVDTGMRRIGVEPGDAVALARAAREAGLSVGGMFTHLPVSDIPAQDAFTATEYRRFFDAVRDVETELGAPVGLVHCANSGGILGHGPELRALETAYGIAPGHVMVRPGIMVYGYYPDATTPRSAPLRPAMELKTRVAFLKPVAAGETVSYGRTWTAPADTWIATIPIGYGDGYSRLLSNRGRVLIAGRSYPIAGRICMDQTMVDVGPGEPDFGVGEEVVVMGHSGEQQITADEIAELTETISYEVTCDVTRRVRRSYEP